jgi:hypothetical protein
MSTQKTPAALRLSAALGDLEVTAHGMAVCDKASAELRRLHSVNVELLEACKVAFDQTCSVGRPKDWEQLRAAIAKATGDAS